MQQWTETVSRKYQMFIKSILKLLNAGARQESLMTAFHKSQAISQSSLLHRQWIALFYAHMCTHTQTFWTPVLMWQRKCSSVGNSLYPNTKKCTFLPITVLFTLLYILFQICLNRWQHLAGLFSNQRLLRWAWEKFLWGTLKDFQTYS